jgi:hypothetical protein
MWRRLKQTRLTNSKSGVFRPVTDLGADSLPKTSENTGVSALEAP